MKNKNENTKIHTRYKTSDGQVIPGVTTITKQIDSGGALIHWAWKLGSEGHDYRKVRDESASVGTLAHTRIMGILADKEVDMGDFTKNQIDKSQISVDKFLKFRSDHKLETILMEEPLVSEKYRYGGTCDWYGKLDGIPTLIDYKTGSGVYPEHYLQINGGYRHLLEEHGHEVQKAMILHINTDEGFYDLRPLSDDTEKYWKAFKCLVDFYYLYKGIKKS